MSTTHSGFSDFPEGEEHFDAAVPSELRALLATISHQIDEADQRHTNLLQEMRDRLVTLSRNAELVRASVPDEAAPAYARIEDSLTHLAQRLDTMTPSQSENEPAKSWSVEESAPAALKSAAYDSTQGDFANGGRQQPSSPAVGIDPFELIGEPDEGETGSVWDQADAEALTRIYEESDAALIRTSPQSESAPVQSEADSVKETRATAMPAIAPASFDTVPSSADVRMGDLDREWLDQRLSDIALRIEQSLSEMSSDRSLQDLGSRFDSFEVRMDTVLGDVATRTDVESLRLLEAQINELAAHFEQSERQLGRLDSIEQQLQAVIEHLSEVPVPAHSEAPVPAEPDFHSLASLAAEQVAQRFAGNGIGAGDDRRFEELNGLLRSMMDDRRQNDEQTYTMLDTVQQAMIRLLDRIDALEMSQVRSQQTFGEPQETERKVVRSAPSADARHDTLDFAEALHGTEPLPAVASAAPELQPAPMSELAAAVSPADKLRQDFIADAQRAKLRAAAAALETPSASSGPVTGGDAEQAASQQRAVRGLPRPKMAAPEAPAQELGGIGGHRQRLTALALCLVIAVSGAALFMKSRSNPAAEPAPPPAVTQKTPKAPVGMTDPVSVEAPAPAAVDGAAFEAPADDEAMVPAPAPNAAAPRSGGGSSADEEVMGLQDELSEGEGLLEHKPQVREPGLAPQGIVLQDAGRSPTVQELVHLQDQKNAATLSSRLGSNAARLTPADLMPEEVAKLTRTGGFSAGSLLPEDSAAFPAAVQHASLNTQPVEMAEPAQSAHKPASLNLPPATVGPLSLRLAAANGDPSAAFEVGARLAEGKGTDQNFKEAVTWYQRSASQGFAQAQYRLGTLYERGLGVKADAGRARMWYQRAAEQGNVKAMHNLAVLSAGRESGSPDYTTAAQWFTSAAEHGLADSQYNLAVLFENGLGVTKSSERAFVWYALAAKSGDKEAARRRDVLEAQLTVAARDEALRTVKIFQPKRINAIVNDPRVAGEDWKKREASAAYR